MSPRLSWESILPTPLALHLATVFSLSPAGLFCPSHYCSAAWTNQWGAPHTGPWGSFSGFSSLILSCKHIRCTFWLFLELCCILSVVGDLSCLLCTSPICTTVSFHLGEIPGSKCLLPTHTPINISPHPVNTEQLQSIGTVIRKVNPAEASTGGMKFVTERSVDQYEKIESISPVFSHLLFKIQ